MANLKNLVISGEETWCSGLGKGSGYPEFAGSIPIYWILFKQIWLSH